MSVLEQLAEQVAPPAENGTVVNTTGDWILDSTLAITVSGDKVIQIIRHEKPSVLAENVTHEDETVSIHPLVDFFDTVMSFKGAAWGPSVPTGSVKSAIKCLPYAYGNGPVLGKDGKNHMVPASRETLAAKGEKHLQTIVDY